MPFHEYLAQSKFPADKQADKQIVKALLERAQVALELGDKAKAADFLELVVKALRS